MPARFQVRTVLLVISGIALVVAVTQQDGPWLSRILITLLLANAMIALAALANAIYRYRTGD